MNEAESKAKAPRSQFFHQGVKFSFSLLPGLEIITQRKDEAMAESRKQKLGEMSWKSD